MQSENLRAATTAFATGREVVDRLRGDARAASKPLAAFHKGRAPSRAATATLLRIAVCVMYEEEPSTLQLCARALCRWEPRPQSFPEGHWDTIVTDTRGSAAWRRRAEAALAA